ncbi:DUF2157 domain-containing protein [Paenisporosarcina antarctica]|uniref:DUF2157 domain-containing protein n=1 Tax=Paenisporosarcina antarctica TaxID=417367 RepID=A0A4P6ZY69_9BACL|nr:DUF2157 domain-containing protein [Paenisporosarcina antarctica]QBP41264.1 DUF2157 domain-containing protein [Paenisporosarcina antarctica]
MKRRVSRLTYEFLKKEFIFLEKTGHLDKGQSNKLIDLYESPTKQVQPQLVKMNAVQILSIIGGILIGLGILSFVASNWSELTKTFKFLILLSTLIVFYVVGFTLEKKKPHLSRAFYYIGAFAYGAEIFYIGQMFHLGGNLEDAFLMWGIGILPLAMFLKDKILKVASLVFVYAFIEIKFLFADGLLEYAPILIIPALFAFGYYFTRNNIYVKVVNFIILYQFIEMTFMFGDDWNKYLPIAIIPALFALNHFVMNKSVELMIANFVLLYQFIAMHFLFEPIFERDSFPYVALLAVPILFYIGHVIMHKSQPLFIVNFTFTLILSALLFYHFEYENFAAIALFYFTLWMLITYIQHTDYKDFMRLTGTILHFPTALILSIPDVWFPMFYKGLGNYLDAPDSKALIASVVFSVFYLIYALTLVKKENLFGVAIVCVFVLRFYVDLSLAFMDKSIAFIIGGLLLLGLGYWFEKTRRKEMVKSEESLKE